MNKKVYYYNEGGKYTGHGVSATVPPQATELKPSTPQDVFNGTIWETPMEPVTLESRLAELKNIRQQKEFGGFTLPDGTFICTDQEDQRKIDGAVLGVQLDPTATINFKGADGYVQLDAETMISIGKALFAHVQACHTREKELIVALGKDLETDITTGWPE